ncbi:hypothetical protein ACGFSD_12230 [Streptomyces caniferus]|uniref:hypothetical protein n=1 Tax=Streptomyces caniferus TaxID=285557 RepID=UPI00371AAD87
MLEPPATSTWRITLPRSPTAVPIARAMVRTAMQDLRATADRTTAQLLTAELVTNALRHTRDADPIELVVELGTTGCRIEVHDGDPLLVGGLGSPPPAMAPDGPGLVVVPGLVGVPIGGGALGGPGHGPDDGPGPGSGPVPGPPGPAPCRTAEGHGTADAHQAGVRATDGRDAQDRAGDGPRAGEHTVGGLPTDDGHLPTQRTERGGRARDADETEGTEPAGRNEERRDGTDDVGGARHTERGDDVGVYGGEDVRADGHGGVGADAASDVDVKMQVDAEVDGSVDAGADPGAPARARADSAPAPHRIDGAGPSRCDPSPDHADDQDPGQGPDHGHGPDQGHDHCRGLLLVRSLSHASGCRPTPRGKAVWFTLPELRRPRRR